MISHLRRFVPTVLIGASLLGAGSAIAAPAAGPPSGYSMVGSPSGGDFGQAEVVWGFDRAAQHYVDIGDGKFAVSSDTPNCPGYFAYFAAPTVVTLPAPSKEGDKHTCALSPGWNLVGNPFSLPAILPTGLVAYHWNHADSTYSMVTSIPAGGGVWIYTSGTTVITITAQ